MVQSIVISKRIVTLSNLYVLYKKCMYVCVSVCPFTFFTYISKTTRPSFTKLSVRVTCGLVLLSQQCNTLCTSFFVDDVMFHIIEQLGKNHTRRVCFVQFTRWWLHLPGMDFTHQCGGRGGVWHPSNCKFYEIS